MSVVDTHYQQAVTEINPREKIARAMELFNWSREFIGREVRKCNPSASPERIKLLVALRLYGNDSYMREIIEGLLLNVPD